MKTYLSVYLGSAILALVITPAVIWGARRINIVDVPGARSSHSKPVPHVGGISLFAAMMCLIVPILILPNVVGDAFRGIMTKVIVLLSAAAFIFVVGLIDDIKGIRARIKLLAQLAAAIAVCSAGIRIERIVIANWLTLDFGWFAWPLTIVWIIGITNAVNLCDGLDGLATGIAGVACGVIAILAISSGQIVMAVLMLAMLGSLTGFLFYNFNPAKIFMGDCGSMFLGFTIAASSVLCSTKSSALVGLALPVLALGIPIFDTLFSMLRRFLQRRSIFASDRSHFHHRLLDLGLCQRHVVIIAYVVTLVMAGLGMFMMVTRNSSSLILLFCIFVLLLLVFRIVGSVRLRETIEGLRLRYAIANRTKDETRDFEAAELHLRRAKTFEQWWRAVSTAAEIMDFLDISLPVTNRDGTIRTLTWHNNGSEADSQKHINASIPVQDRRPGPPLDLKIEAYADGSLESAGRRIALFTRLVEEHDIAALNDNSG